MTSLGFVCAHWMLQAFFAVLMQIPLSLAQVCRFARRGVDDVVRAHCCSIARRMRHVCLRFVRSVCKLIKFHAHNLVCCSYLARDARRGFVMCFSIVIGRMMSSLTMNDLCCVTHRWDRCVSVYFVTCRKVCWTRPGTWHLYFLLSF